MPISQFRSASRPSTPIPCDDKHDDAHVAVRHYRSSFNPDAVSKVLASQSTCRKRPPLFAEQTSLASSRERCGGTARQPSKQPCRRQILRCADPNSALPSPPKQTQCFLSRVGAASGHLSSHFLTSSGFRSATERDPSVAKTGCLALACARNIVSLANHHGRISRVNFTHVAIVSFQLGEVGRIRFMPAE